MATKKYLSLTRLGEYDELIKSKIDSGDSSTLASAKSYADGLVSGKADTGHAHDDRYYTESEIDTKLSAVNTSITNITNGEIVVKEAEHAGTADSATTAGSANTANTANSATKATQDGNGKVIANTYETKSDATAKLNEAKEYADTTAEEVVQGFIGALLGMYGDDWTGEGDIPVIRTIANDEATTALDSAKTYADSAASKVKNDLLNGAGTAYDTLKELGDLIDENADAIEALESIASGKADADHDHAIADVSGLQSALDGKAASSHGTHVTYSTTAPVMDGTASAGSASTVARSDHKHPTDTSRASKTEFDTHVADTTKHITSTERTNWGAAYTHSQAAHAPSDARANVIESIKVNGTAQTITSKTVNITVPTQASDIGAATASHSHAISDITNLQTTLNNASSAITANTNSISTHTDKIAALEGKIGDGFEEITSSEIQALFA